MSAQSPPSAPFPGDRLSAEQTDQRTTTPWARRGVWAHSLCSRESPRPHQSLLSEAMGVTPGQRSHLEVRGSTATEVSKAHCPQRPQPTSRPFLAPSCCALGDPGPLLMSPTTSVGPPEAGRHLELLSATSLPAPRAGAPTPGMLAPITMAQRAPPSTPPNPPALCTQGTAPSPISQQENCTRD